MAPNDRVTSRIRHELPELDEIIRDEDPDFGQTGLKTASLIRVSRLAVVSAGVIRGSAVNMGIIISMGYLAGKLIVKRE